jgi:ribosomal protein S27E
MKTEKLIVKCPNCGHSETLDWNKTMGIPSCPECDEVCMNPIEAGSKGVPPL